MEILLTHLIIMLKNILVTLGKLFFGAAISMAMPFTVILLQHNNVSLLSTPTITQSSKSTESVDITKKVIDKRFIIFVHSYSLDNPCTVPQRESFSQNVMQILLKDKEITYGIREFYMEAKEKNTTKELIDNASNIILRRIDELKPEYIFITDDIAFEKVGIQCANLGYKVIASGINTPLSEYTKNYKINTNNILLIQEPINIDLFLNLIESAKFKPNKYYVLYDNTETSYYMTKDYEKQLYLQNTAYIKITTVEELKKFIISIQNDPVGVIVITLQSLKEDSGKSCSREKFFKEFLEYNKKHLELGGNIIYSRYGYSVCNGPDFYKMAEKVSKYFLENYYHKKFEGKVLIPTMYLTINKLRLKQLSLDSLTRGGFSIISAEYDKIEQN